MAFWGSSGGWVLVRFSMRWDSLSKACSLRQWRLENLSDSRGFESGSMVVRLVGWLIFSLAPHVLVSGCFDVGVSNIKAHKIRVAAATAAVPTKLSWRLEHEHGSEQVKKRRGRPRKYGTETAKPH
ncbi:unnamed protein product [Brassica rapa subsp. narinosa]|uniref:(rape) hypothetical protein n=1 Tax=Brassica napus TaxID=3708 RepID=A0A816WFD1_BRANA|nr:unnamed protein product [Brassica napus]